MHIEVEADGFSDFFLIAIAYDNFQVARLINMGHIDNLHNVSFVGMIRVYTTVFNWNLSIGHSNLNL